MVPILIELVITVAMLALVGWIIRDIRNAPVIDYNPKLPKPRNSENDK